MDLMPSDEQRSIIASVSELLGETMPTSRVRALAGKDLSELQGFWLQAAGLGWFGLGLEEEHGGAGYGLADEALMFREIGRSVTPGPLLSTVLAARVASYGGAAELATRILAGQEMVGHAVPAPGAQLQVAERVTGEVELLNAVGSSYLLVTTPDTAALVPVDACHERREAPPIEDSGSRETARLDGVAVAAVPAEVDRVHRRGQVLTTAVLVGICEATRDMATSYAKTRVQFGQPIGIFQAIKHRCADMAVGADAAVNQMLFAALSVVEGRPDADFQVAAARVVADRAAMWNARENIQVHGGMGFTAECDAHLYVKRTHLLSRTFGGLRGAQADLLAQPPAQ